MKFESRRGLLRHLWALLLIALGAAVASIAQVGVDPAAAQPTTDSSITVIGMTVGDLDRSVTFFSEVLSFETVGRRRVSGEAFARLNGLPSAEGQAAILKLGDELLELTAFELPPGRNFPAGTRSNDRWFQHIAIIVSDMDRAYARLVEHGVRPASRGGPQRLPDWNENAAGIRAFYFRDPDGHFLELLQFPPGKGDPKWQRRSDRLFLGIDHTAFVVADTDASLRFYRDLLGLRIAGQGENHGPEQERLNNVRGARLRITTLRADAGPAIELLEYLNPRDGRPYPADTRPNDLLYWQTTLLVQDAAATAEALGRAGRSPLAPEPVHSAGIVPGSTRAFIVRDPDGHAIRVVEK